MARRETLFVCNNCSYESAKWLGQCPSCRSWNTFEEIEPKLEIKNTLLRSYKITKTRDIQDKSLIRLPSGFSEIDRILGGGLVSSEVVLISGEPGIGKSTLLLQLLEAQKKAVYISAEESIEQVGMRFKRIFPRSEGDLDLLSCFDLETVLTKLDELKPGFVVIDSIQTIYSNEARGLPGGVSQIKAVASRLVNYAKANDVVMFIVGQITKQGDVAGPKLLEHLVDVVLQLEGDDKFDFRVLRCYKNRFGPTAEVGLFEMTEKGMQEVANPALYFLRDVNDDRVGVCPGIINEGNRIIIVEVQALTVRSYLPIPKRVTEGITKSRLELICAIIAKYTKLKINEFDIYLNIAGGIKSYDPMLDLAIANAIISSLLDKPLKREVVAFGEVALTGQIRFNKQKERIEKEIKRLGYIPYNEKYPKIKYIADLENLVSKKA
jgi:DNA repair protein RadA/Sms